MIQCYAATQQGPFIWRIWSSVSDLLFFGTMLIAHIFTVRSVDDDRKCDSSWLREMDVTFPIWPKYVRIQPLETASHNLILRSWDPVKMVSSSSTARHETAPWWPEKTRMQYPLSKFHNRAVWSSDPLTKAVPLSTHARDNIAVSMKEKHDKGTNAG